MSIRLAFDLGAESGRGMLGRFDGERLELTELRRFPNVAVRVLEALYWDPLRLLWELQETLRACAAERGPHQLTIKWSTNKKSFSRHLICTNFSHVA